MFKSILSMALLSSSLLLPTAAHAQIDSWQADEAISDILGAGRIAGQVRQLHQVPSVGVFDTRLGVSSRLYNLGDQGTRLSILAEKNAFGVNQLRRALASNSVTRETMAEHNVDVNHVIGVSIGGSGSLRFFLG